MKKMSTEMKVVLSFVAAAVLIIVGIQLIPVERSNPPATTQVMWDSPQTQELFQRACADCHSNETVWPWYSHIAPVSWLVAHDVSDGRRRLNVSQIDPTSERFKRTVSEIEEVVGEGEMPMPIYLIMHPNARLTAEEKQILIRGLQASLSATQASQ